MDMDSIVDSRVHDVCHLHAGSQGGDMSIKEALDAKAKFDVLNLDATSLETVKDGAGELVALDDVIAGESHAMAAWIEKALPHLEEQKYEAEGSIAGILEDVEGWEQSPGYRAVVDADRKRVAELDALIQEATK